MRVRIVAGMLVGLLVAAATQAGDAPADMKLMKGTWQLKSEVKEGEKRPDDYVKSIKLSFDKSGDWTATKDGELLFKGTSKLDPSQKPKQLDMTLTAPEENKGVQVQAIYEVKGDTLRICWTVNGERPTEFEAKDASGRTYAVFKRAKSK